jgi:Esterase/lipase
MSESLFRGPLFRGMDAAAIDRQYNFRKLVPEHVDFFARWEAQSAAVRGRLGGTCDIPVGPHPRQKVDFFPAEPNAPLLVFIHGGYWRALSKDMHAFIAEPFVTRGVAVALIGYGLCPDVTMDELIGHAQHGLDWIIDHAAEFGADSRRLLLAGHSAGGHLAATLLSRNPERVNGAIAISGIYDLEPLLHFEVNEQLRLDADSARRLSPVHNVPAPAPAPLLALALGAEETDEMHRQQADQAQAWAAAGNAVQEIVEPGANHFSVMDRFADPDSALFEATMNVIRGTGA